MVQASDGGGEGMSDFEADERVDRFKPGHVLTDQDVKDIQTILDEHDKALVDAAGAFHQGQRDAIRRIGGDELLKRWDTLNEMETNAAVEKAMKHFDEQMAKYGKRH